MLNSCFQGLIAQKNIQLNTKSTMSYSKPCPECGHSILYYRNPVPTVDIIIFSPPGQVVLIERKNPPHGWALPGGFVDYGESVEQAALREAKEETGLDVVLTGLLGVYSDPRRDPRFHTLSIVFTANAMDLSKLKANDDARQARLFSLDDLPELAFDHGRILRDYIACLDRFKV